MRLWLKRSSASTTDGRSNVSADLKIGDVVCHAYDKNRSAIGVVEAVVYYAHGAIEHVRVTDGWWSRDYPGNEVVRKDGGFVRHVGCGALGVVIQGMCCECRRTVWEEGQTDGE